MKILAVDFDGVISDSALKSLFVSHNAYCKYFSSEVKKNFGGELFTFDNWEKMQKQYKKEIDNYRRLRSYIELPGDFFAIIKIMEEQIQIKNQQEFITYRNQLQFDHYFLKKKRNGRKRVLKNGFFCHLFLRKSSKGFSDLQRKGKKLSLLLPILGKPFMVPFNRNILVLRLILKIFLIKISASIKQSICRLSLKSMAPN
jgi:hypothetical protein